MNLQEAKYFAMAILFGSPLIMTAIGIYLQRFLLHRSGYTLAVLHSLISCLTSGIFLGTFLMLILPNALDLIADHYLHRSNIGYILIGLGFFLICFMKEIIDLFESRFTRKKISNIDQEQLLNSTMISVNENQLTRLISLVFALGVHYFFTGVIIGGQTKDTTSLWLLLTAICFHMSLVAFSVTLRLLIDNENYLRVFLAMSLWSLMGSLGVLLSLWASSNPSELHMINGVLQCLSAGTFVYITFIDMLYDDLIKSRSYPFLNVILIFTGFVITVCTVIWHQHSH